jgi:Peptidase family M28
MEIRMKSPTSVLILTILVAASLASGAAAQQALPRTHTPEPTTSTITASDLMTRLYIFAADSMQGREAGTIGNVKGTDYIASELARIGLVPAGDNGSYFQTVPYKTRTVDSTSALVVDGTAVRVGNDFLPASGALVASGLKAVYGGEISTDGVPITPEQARGRLVVLTATADASARRLRRYRVPGAAAVAIAMLDDVPQDIRATFLRPQGFLDDPSQTAAAAAPVLLVSRRTAGRMISGSLDQLQPGAEGANVDVDIHYRVSPMPYPSRNVVGIIPGSDPQLAHEYVAIGAHNDHIGLTDHPLDHDSIRIWNHVVRPEGADDSDKQATSQQQTMVNTLLAQYRTARPGSQRLDSISNGADDDGSGTVTVLEIAERIASLSPTPKRSILFVFHVGEEKGLLGSEWYTDHPTVPRDSIVAQLNMDMVGRGGANDETARAAEGQPQHGGPNYLLLVGSRRLSTELGDLVERVNTEDGHGLTFDYTFDAEDHPSRIYERSDHYEYARYGIPIVFFTTGLHSDYHQVTDEPQYIDYDHMAKIGNLVEDVAVHVGNLDHRVKVDRPIAP